MNEIEKNRKNNASLFDDAEINEGHFSRFENKLDNEFRPRKNKLIPWLSIAASVLIALGFGWHFFTPNNSKTPIATNSNSEENTIPVDQAEYYYQHEFDKQLAVISENFTDTTSKKMIEESIVVINELRTEYKILEEELKNTGNYQVATAMIINYKSRISVLEQLVSKLNYVNQLKNKKDENTNV